jgi:rhodanese-related sulfurtransferase
VKLATALRFVGSYLRPARVGELAPAELHARLGAPDLAVFDCNLRGRYERGHVPGAAHFDWDAGDAAALPRDRGAMLVFYCASAL